LTAAIEITRAELQQPFYFGVCSHCSPNSFPNRIHLCVFSTCHFRRCSSHAAFAPQGSDLVAQALMESPLWQYC